MPQSFSYQCFSVSLGMLEVNVNQFFAVDYKFVLGYSLRNTKLLLCFINIGDKLIVCDRGLPTRPGKFMIQIILDLIFYLRISNGKTRCWAYAASESYHDLLCQS